MQNEAHTSCISNYAKKITLKTGHVMKKIVTQNLYHANYLVCFSCYTLFLPVNTVYKEQRRFENQNFPFRECTNYILDIREQNYATYAINAVTSRLVFGAKPTSLAKRTEFDYYCLHAYAFSEKTNRVIKDFNVIYL